MSVPVNPRRRYDSSGRQAQARQNRGRILAAAHRLWLDNGYASTTLAAVADEAAVSVETIYKAFENKAGLLKAVVDVAVVGDDEPIPMLKRAAVGSIVAEPEPRTKLRMYCDLYIQNASLVAPIRRLVREAAATDAAAATVWEQMGTERLAGMAAFAEGLHRGGHLRPDVGVDEARDVLWTYNSAELWELLVTGRRWTPERFGHWIGDALIAALL